MKLAKFISIGTKGTCLPLALQEIKPPLVIGENHLRWAGRGSHPEAQTASGWVSENGEPFSLHYLDQALSEGRVVHVPHMTWIAKADGKRHVGEVFFPKSWKRGDPQPVIVAVRSETWPHGCVERTLICDKRNAATVARFEWNVQPPQPSTPPRRGWTRQELLVALNLYHKLNFGQFHARQPVIVDVAGKLGRTPDSLAMKLCNLASLDPVLRLRGVKGLEGASGLDKEMWQAFQDQPDTLAVESEEAFRGLFEVNDEREIEVINSDGVTLRGRTPVVPQGDTEVFVNVKARRGQQYFRQVVLNNFDNRCGITAIAVRELLIASHILPWRDHPKHRLDKENGICLSRLHDAAFDRGLITFDEELRLVLGSRLRAALPQPALEHSFVAYEGKSLLIPKDARPPSSAFLAIHRSTLFQR